MFLCKPGNFCVSLFFYVAEVNAGKRYAHFLGIHQWRIFNFVGLNLVQMDLCCIFPISFVGCLDKGRLDLPLFLMVCE